MNEWIKDVIDLQEQMKNEDGHTRKKVVEVAKLTKIYENKTKAVDEVSFDIYDGEIFGLLGPNGAGKSTTVKMLTTLLRPTSGHAYVGGYDISKDPQSVRWEVGVVPQEYTADEDLTGRENVLLFASLYGIPRKEAEIRATELLDLVELKDAANRKVMTYSGGMRRRLELACGLVNRPDFLFLDEPTLGLDVQTRAAVWKYIKDLKEVYGMTILMTTHYLEEADGLCDRVAIIDHGKIIKIGEIDELKESLGGDIIMLSTRENEDITSIISGVDRVKEVKIDGGSYRIKAEMGEEVAPDIIEAVRNAGHHVSRISVTKPTMDEVYLEYTGHTMRDEEAKRGDMFSQRMTLRRARR